MPEATKQHGSEGELASDSKAAGSPASPPSVPVSDMVEHQENQLAPTYDDTPLAVAEELQAERSVEDDVDDADSGFGDKASSTASVASSILHYRNVNGRTYHSDRSVNLGADLYWGANDGRQNVNLDIMHEVFTIALDGKLHLAPLPEKLEKALDIGTGTGLWCIDFGDDHPECRVVGTDLSPIQPSWIPPNVCFEIDDYTQEWTFEENSLDFVHLRWLVGTVTDWTELFRQAYRVLKPGGWVESFECNGFLESDDGTLTEDTAASKWGYFFREGARVLGSKASFSVVRDDLQVKGLREANFTSISERNIKVPSSEWAKDEKHKQMGYYMRSVFENDIEGAIGFMASQLGWTKDEITVYAARLRKEIRTNAVHSFSRCKVAWAQKPLNP